MLWNYCWYINIFLLQIRSTPISPRFWSPVMLLFRRLSRDPLPRLSITPMLCNNDEINCTVFTNRQHTSNKETDINADIFLLPSGSTVAVQWKDRGPWMHGMIMGNWLDGTMGDATRSELTNTQCIMTLTRQCVMATLISTEDCLRNENSTRKCRSKELLPLQDLDGSAKYLRLFLLLRP